MKQFVKVTTDVNGEQGVVELFVDGDAEGRDLQNEFAGVELLKLRFGEFPDPLAGGRR